MKIQTPFEAFKPVDSIRSKKDGQGGAAQQQYETLHDGKGKRGQNQDQAQEGADSQAVTSEPREIEPVVMELALKTFEQDAKTNQSGLTALVEGTGPGLRVILKDASGRVLRSLSGQEFLKLRERSNLDTRARGKLLDQKY